MAAQKFAFDGMVMVLPLRARMRVPKFLSQDEVGCAFQAIFTSSRAHHKQLTKQNQKHSHTENEFSARVRVYATLLFCSMKSV